MRARYEVVLARQNAVTKERNERYLEELKAIAERKKFRAIRAAERKRLHEARAALQRERLAEYREKTLKFAVARDQVLSQMRKEFLASLAAVRVAVDVVGRRSPDPKNTRRASTCLI